MKRKRYLFIRLLESCNAGCFMCSYAHSRDRYRFSIEEFRQIIAQTGDRDIAYVRFTGGEPLLHKDIVGLVAAGTQAGLKMSIITNGRLLPRMIDRLTEAGLDQVIVSIDGASADSHDHQRNVSGLFDACIAGLELASERGMLTRVNTVVGSHNYKEIPRLQSLLSSLCVQQWELSALKLDPPVTYPDPESVLDVCEPVYQASPATTLLPMGKRFYGNTAEERALFFASGTLPRPGPPACHLIGDVIYLDAKAGHGFGCSLLPHRDAKESGGGITMRGETGWHLGGAIFDQHVAVFRDVGPLRCRGCSTTAAGYSEDVARGHTLTPWHF